MKFLSFWSKDHWKRTILSRVMILFGFNMVLYGTLWCLMVPYGFPFFYLFYGFNGEKRMTKRSKHEEHIVQV